MYQASELIIRHPRQLTVAWAQKIVSHFAASAEVFNVNVIALDVGTTTRIQLHVDHNGPDQIPRNWFIKLPSLTWRARAITALPRLLATEVHFYQHIVPQVPLQTAAVLAAASNLLTGSTLVIGDINEIGAQPGQAGQALTAAQAEAVVKQLAKFHGQFWNPNQQHPHLQRLAGPTRALEDLLGSILAVPLMKLGLQKAANLIPATLQLPAVGYARQRRRIMAVLNQGPQTLIHRDCHPGNFFWHDNQPGFLDWQLVRIGEGMADVAYLLATALEADVRRAHETDLIKTYATELKIQGIACDFDQLWPRYQLHLCYPFEAMLLTLAIGGLMEPLSNRIMLSRAAQAVADHQVFDLLQAACSRA